MREKLLSLNKKDFRFDYFRGSGKGGQKKNKTSSACRVTHIETGLNASCEDGRSQKHNRETAFKKLFNNPKFQFWLRQESMRVAGIIKTEQEIKNDIDKQIERDLQNGNIKIEEI